MVDFDDVDATDAELDDAIKSGDIPESHAHAWCGTWDRPMRMDENKLHPFTVARMTDHNVRGADNDEVPLYDWIGDPTGSVH